MPRVATLIVLVVLLIAGAAVGIIAFWRGGQSAGGSGQPRGAAAVAVEVTPVRAGLIRDVRQFSGTLEAAALFSVSPKVGGRVRAVHVDLGDTVERGQVIAEIDDAEYVHTVAKSEAELAVRRAELTGAQSNLTLAQSEFDRAQALKERGIASESQLDETTARLASATAALALAEAQVQQAEASLELARIQLGYTQVRADWGEGAETATVGERFVDPGGMIQVGDRIVSVATLDPLTAVINVTERDYPSLRIGQPATLTTDALPGRRFDAEVVRIAPVFRETSRQARVELAVSNETGELRPGMFIRVRIVLQEEDAAAIIPLAAITRRSGEDVVFVVDETGQGVKQWGVKMGITEGDEVAVTFLPRAEETSVPRPGARVVTLGQQLLGDGSPVNVEEGLGAGAWRTPGRELDGGAG